MAKEVRIVMEVNGEQSNVVTPVSESVITEALGYTPVDSSKVGSGSGLAELDENGLVPTSQLPSYIDDVLNGYLYESEFYEDQEHTILLEKESGKIYIDVETNKTYRWSGNDYVVISETLALGETSSTAYRGDRGKIAYDHSQSTHAPVDAEKNQNAFSNIVVGDKYITSTTTSDNINIESGENISINVDNDNRKIIINATDTTYGDVTEETSGLMNPEDYKKLNNIEDGANKYTLPTAGTELGGVKTGGNVTIEDGIINVNDNSHLHSIENVEGLQKALDSKSSSTHTHKYAGSSTVGGSATSAIKLTTDAGASNKPVYFENGIPMSCNYELNADVPENAVFTDTNTWRGIQDNLTSDSAEDSLSANQGKILNEKIDSNYTELKEYTDSEIANLVGTAPETLDTIHEVAEAIKNNESVVEALDEAIGTKANETDLTSHTTNTSNPHSVTKSQVGLGNVENKSSETIRGELTKKNVTDALGYTPPEQDTTYSSLKNPYAITIQGNGTTLTNGVYDGSAAKTINITPSSIGAAASSHGTHVTFESTATPKANGTAANGTATTVSRSDHVHPLQTTVSGNAGTATKFASAQSVTLTGDVTGTNSSQAGWSVATTLANSGVTAGSYGPSANASPAHSGTFSVPYITVDAKGRVIGASSKTITLPASGNTDTKNTAGSTNSSSKLFLIGATSQAANPQTYSHDTAYVGTDGCLYSNSTKVSVEGHTHSYLPLSGGNMNDDTYIRMAFGTDGRYTDYAHNIKMVAPNAGWSNGISYYLSNGTTSLGTIGAYGTATELNYFFIGPSYSNTYLKLDTSGNGTFKGTVTATSFSGNASSATKLATARTIDGVSFNGSAAIHHYGTCSTAAGTAAKVVALSGFSLVTGAKITVVFSESNTADAVTLNVNSTGAKAVFYNGSAMTHKKLKLPKDIALDFVYNGTNWIHVGNVTTVTQSNSTADNNYRLLLSFAADDEIERGSSYKSSKFTANPSTGVLSATTFSGSGASLTSLNASNVSSGTLAAARLATSGVTAGSYGPSANASPTHSGTFSVPYITVDNKGRVTAASSKTITLPASGDTDTKVTQTYSSSSTSGNYPLLLRATNSITGTSSTTTTSRFCNSFYATPSTGIIHATAFSSIGTNLITSGTASFTQWTDEYTPTTVAIALTDIDKYSSLAINLSLEYSGSMAHAVLPITYLLASTSNSIWFPIGISQDIIDANDDWIGSIAATCMMKVKATSGTGLTLYWPVFEGKCVDITYKNMGYKIFKI